MHKEHRYHVIDLLRFAAALSVLLFHYSFRGIGPDHLSDVTFPTLGAMFRYGYLGVQLFFMISGFVILLTAMDRKARAFVASRIVRLYPAYWACVTLTFVVTALIGGSRFSATTPQYLVNLTMLQAAAHVPPIDGVYWSLNVELRFYALVFLVVLFGQTRRLQHFLALWLTASVVLSHSQGWHIARSLLFPDYSYFFIAGAAFLLIRLQGVSIYRLLIIAVSYAEAIRCSVLESVELSRFFQATIDPLTVAGIVTAFFLVFVLIARGATRYLDDPRFATLGALTYPLYLLHQHVGFMIFNAAGPYLPHDVLLVAVTALILGVAYGVHRWIEVRHAPQLKRFLTWVLRLADGDSARHDPAPHRRRRPRVSLPAMGDTALGDSGAF